jgi:hypothetical protein
MRLSLPATMQSIHTQIESSGNFSLRANPIFAAPDFASQSLVQAAKTAHNSRNIMRQKTAR